MSLEPYYKRNGIEIYCGDCLTILPQLKNIDALITDPPYSSGGQFRGDRIQKPSAKYVQTESMKTCRIEFSGDNRDQRAFLLWATMWMQKVFDISNPGSIALVFTDWRQLPTITDAIQCGGWIWRNIVTWWKPGIRMQKGRFSSSAEYIIYASKGIPIEGQRSPQNVLSYKPVNGVNKFHIAEKPVNLIENIIGVTHKDAIILDPFMGSGTTGIACIKQRRKFVGIEKDEHHLNNAIKRIKQFEAQTDLFRNKAV